MTIQHIGGRDVVVMDRLSSPSQEDVQVLIRKLYSSLLSYGLYPPGHTMIGKRIQELHQHILKMFQESSLLVLACEQELIINKIRILRNVPEKEASTKAASYLGLRGVKNLVLWPRVTHDDMQRLFHTWHTINEEDEEEALDLLHGFQSQQIRMNMDLVSSADWEVKNQQGPIAISKHELAEILSHIGPQGTGQVPHLQGQGMEPPQSGGGRSPTANIQLVGSGWGSNPSSTADQEWTNQGRDGRPQSLDNMSASPGGVVQAQQVLQHVGGQVVQAQQVIQQHQGVIGADPRTGYAPTDFSGMVYPHAASGMLPTPRYPGAGSTQGMGGYIPEGAESVGGLDASRLAEAQHTGLPPGLREPAALHPARQVSPAGEMFERMGMMPTGNLRGEGDGDTVIQSYPPASAQTAGLTGTPRPEMGIDSFRISEVTPSVADLPEIQGYFFEPEDKTQPGWKNPHQASQVAAPGASWGQDVTAGIRDTLGHLAGPPLPQQPVGLERLGAEYESTGHTGPGMAGIRSHSPTSTLGDATDVGANPLYPPAVSDISGANLGMPISFGGGRPSAIPSPQMPQTPSLDWVRADPVSLDQSGLDIAQLDFGKIEPASLFHSQRFRAFLTQGGVGLYLSRFLGALMSTTSAHQAGQVVAVQNEGGWLGMQGGQSLMKAVEQMPDPFLQQEMVRSLAETISSTAPDLIDEQIAHLGTSASERLLRQEILQQIPAAWRPSVAELLHRRLAQAHLAEQIHSLMTTMSMLIEEQLETTGWMILVPTLEILAQLSVKFPEKTATGAAVKHWLELSTSPDTGRVLFQQLLYSDSPDERALAERGVVAMGAASAYNLTLFLELAHDLSREQALLYTAQKVASQLEEVEQTLFFEQLWEAGLTLPKERHHRLCRTIYTMRADLLEKYLVERLDAMEKAEEGTIPSSEWAHWTELALLCHTPRLRQYLGRYLQARKLLEWPDIEEKMLALLDNHGTVQGFQFLEHIVHSQRHPQAWKVTAVRLLGSLRTEESLLLLRRILLERKRFLRQPIYTQDLRYQALLALTFFPQRQVVELVKKICQDSNETLRHQAQKMLDLWAEQT